VEEVELKQEQSVAEPIATTESHADLKASHKQLKSEKQRETLNTISVVTSEDVVYGRDNIEEEFRGVLMKLWKETSSSYKSQLMKVLGKQRG
jgi:hypothetical protein